MTDILATTADTFTHAHIALTAINRSHRIRSRYLAIQRTTPMARRGNRGRTRGRRCPRVLDAVVAAMFTAGAFYA
jgi:hypothetical protein